MGKLTYKHMQGDFNDSIDDSAISQSSPVNLSAFLHLERHMLPCVCAGADALLARLAQLRAQLCQAFRIVHLRFHPGTR